MQNSEMYEMICVVISGLTFMWVIVVSAILESMALIEVSLEELPVSAIFGSVLPSNNDRSTRAQLIWVVLPQLVSELADSLPEMAAVVF